MPTEDHCPRPSPPAGPAPAADGNMEQPFGESVSGNIHIQGQFEMSSTNLFIRAPFLDAFLAAFAAPVLCSWLAVWQPIWYWVVTTDIYEAAWRSFSMPWALAGGALASQGHRGASGQSGMRGSGLGQPHTAAMQRFSTSFTS